MIQGRVRRHRLGTDQEAETGPDRAVSLALQRHEGVTDQGTGQAAEADGGEGGDAHPDRRQRGEGRIGVARRVHGAAAYRRRVIAESIRAR